MANVIRAEWYRATHSWRFWVTMALAIALFGLTMVQYANPWLPARILQENNLYTVTLACLGGYFEGFWVILVPIVAVLPAGDGMAVDRRRGADAVIITRVGWTTYLVGKMVGNALVAVSAVAVAIAVAMGTAALLYPVTLPPFLGWAVNNALPYHLKLVGAFGDAYPPAFDPHFFWAAPGLYILVVVGLALWVTAVLSSLSILAALWIRQPILTMAGPMVLYLGVNVLTQSFLRDGHLNPAVYAGAYLYWAQPGPSWAALVFYWTIPALIVLLMLSWVGHYRREWPVRSVEQ